MILIQTNLYLASCYVQLDNRVVHDYTSVSEPTTILYLGLGLTEVISVRRKFKN
jgi:hypothetical protein